MTDVRDLRSSLQHAADDLTGECDVDQLPFETTDDLVALDAVFGQERAVRAIEFSLGIEGRDYHLYASGPDGFGKTTIVESFLRRRARALPAPPDWVYVRNFRDPDRPIGIRLPAGHGHAFAREVEQTVERAVEDLAAAFDSDTYVRQRTEVGKAMDLKRQALLEQLAQHAAEVGFQLQMTPSGIVSAPLVDGQPLTDETFQALPEEQRKDIETRAQQLEGTVQDSMLLMRGIERETQDALEELDTQVARYAIEHLFAPLIERHATDRELIEFLEAVRDDLRSERGKPPQAPSPLAAMGGPQANPLDALKRRYAVNTFVQHDPQRGAPVIVERHPTYYNLVGRIEYMSQFGAATTDHTLIKAGSLARASGGYLVVRLRDLLANAQAYEGLKRALHAQELAIENLGESLGLIPTTVLRPEAMPLDVRVTIVGDASLYGLLYRLDPDFRELFRVKADFETDFERTEENVRGLAALARRQTVESGLRPFTRNAIARLVEHSSRLVEDQRRLSANLGQFVDMLRQADYWAEQEGAATVTAVHVDRALEEAEFRSSLVRDRVQQMIDDGQLLLETDGRRVGQINGLSVYDLGDFSFGRPSKITCVVSAGRGNLINIERETNAAGRIHNKGFLIVRALLSSLFGQDRELAMTASLTFEQLYGEIDGDSASSTEVYAILSALADVPIDQGIAVTGSVNQHGEIQPIGGATVKIEGFYEVCRARGLTGSQGVIIPRSNVHNVLLKPEVARAIEDGRFHVWSVASIAEGIEVLTGLPAGKRGEDGRYAEGSVFRRAEDRLDAFYHSLAEHAHPGGPTDSRPVSVPQQPPPPTPPGVPPEPPPEPPISVAQGRA